jgi:L-ascorbate metabolism protein UlaG (beta-lactamase superfamily)
MHAVLPAGQDMVRCLIQWPKLICDGVKRQLGAGAGKRRSLTQVNYIGHATVLIDIGQIRVLTDPILRDRFFFMKRNGHNHGPDLLAARPPDIVLLSHLHYDHADLPSLRRLPSTTTVIAPKGSGGYLARWAGVHVCEVAEGDRVQVGDVDITVLPSDHGNAYSRPRPMTTCLSYALCNHLSVYFAGDTDLFDGMDEIGQDFDLDIALLPVWGYSHRVGSGHLTPMTAAQALARLHPRVAVPIHWGSFHYPGPRFLWERADYMNTPPHAFAEYASRLAPETDVRILQPGEWTSVT